MHQCKRHLNGETPEEPIEQTHLNVQTVPFQLHKGVGASQPVADDENQAEDPSGAAQPADDKDDEGSDDQNDASSDVSFDKVRWLQDAWFYRAFFPAFFHSCGDSFLLLLACLYEW